MAEIDYAPFEKARRILANAWQPGGAVEPAILDILLDLLIDLIGGCFGSGSSAKDILRIGRSNKLLDRLGVRAQLIERVRGYLVRAYGFGGYIRHNGPRIVDTMIVAVRDPETEETDLQALMALRLPN